MKTLLRALSVLSFAALLTGATYSFWARSVALAAAPPPSASDAGLDAGSSVSAIFGDRDRGYLAGSKSFGGGSLDAQGFGGLGLRGSGRALEDGGGSGDAQGIGGLALRGSSEPLVTGPMDKELIRKVINTHRAEISGCYEKQLARVPKLQGKVAVKFVISATGAVSSSTVATSTVADPELESCVTAAVLTWVFPKPKGGGVVITTYPFVFSSTRE